MKTVNFLVYFFKLIWHLQAKIETFCSYPICEAKTSSHLGNWASVFRNPRPKTNRFSLLYERKVQRWLAWGAPLYPKGADRAGPIHARSPAGAGAEQTTAEEGRKSLGANPNTSSNARLTA